MNYLGLFRAVFLLTLVSNLSFAAELDSLRLENRGGKQFVIHRVGQGETLYAISRRYKSSVGEISKVNDLQGNSVSIGQEIAIPWNSGDQIAKSNTITKPAETYHTVEAGQTLYAIARQYEISVDELKRLNRLTSNELSTGQQLVVKKAEKSIEEASSVKEGAVSGGNDGFRFHTVATSETLFSISQKYDVSVDEIKKWNELKDNGLSVGQKLIVGKTSEISQKPVAVVEDTPSREKKKELIVNETGSLKQINKQGYTRDTATVAGYEKVVEEGFAMVIDNSPETRKFLALHRTAPIGAILEVKNRMNGRSIYVRVVGKLPDTGANNKVLIRLSEKAFQRLESVDPKVPVEVSYVP